MTFIAFAGDVHGHLSTLYEKLSRLQEELKRPIDCVFQVGDFQIFSDSSRLDGAILRHGGPGEFPVWFREKTKAPIPTYVILGNHGALFKR